MQLDLAVDQPLHDARRRGLPGRVVQVHAVVQHPVTEGVQMTPVQWLVLLEDNSLTPAQRLVLVPEKQPDARAWVHAVGMLELRLDAVTAARWRGQEGQQPRADGRDLHSRLPRPRFDFESPVVDEIALVAQ